MPWSVGRRRRGRCSHAFATAAASDWHLRVNMVLLQVLLGEKQYDEARELMQAALDVCGRR